mmetsp:Transcript_13510/g.16252  ORF Transcript_13510/g.16252 Transcript_13510/m.16252 type:complete len:136 (+) Transcript_13510:155-562(+)|eukprot:CAMPEP_0197868296 /NCGR_PEP_ID=MMETSP1438-20131217/45211_1 /TAXON_ID=1461541 /ORGANISM="Pterosperma sp., Strain CCMP1384" /LENGTH=135 /DNA_ID=CAMNT_0043486997 /DNA_START=736 /DNA_END=1143 /DNA_ORIENTATION=-
MPPPPAKPAIHRSTLISIVIAVVVVAAYLALFTNVRDSVTDISITDTASSSSGHHLPSDEEPLEVAEAEPTEDQDQGEEDAAEHFEDEEENAAMRESNVQELESLSEMKRAAEAQLEASEARVAGADRGIPDVAH